MKYVLLLISLVVCGCSPNFNAAVMNAAEAAKIAGVEYCGCSEVKGTAAFSVQASGRSVSCTKVGDVDMDTCMTSFGYGAPFTVQPFMTR